MAWGKFSISILLFFTLLMRNQLLIAKPVVEAANITDGYVVNNEVAYFVDSTVAYDIQQIIPHPELLHQNENGYLSFGYLDRQVWLKFTIHSTVKKQLVLEHHPYHIDTIGLYVVKQGQLQNEQKNGIHFLKNGNKSNIALGRIFFPFTIDSGYTDIYIKLRADYSSIRATLKLWNEQDFSKRKISFLETEQFQYILTGFMLFAAFLGILLFINYHSWVYLTYSLFVLLNIFMVYTIKGWIIPYLQWFSFYSYDLRGLTNSLVIAASSWYFYILIPPQYSSTIIRKVFLIFISLIIISFTISILIPNNITLYTALFYLLKPVLIIAVPIAIFHFAYAVKKGYAIAWFFMLSLFPIFINSIFHVLQLANIIPSFYPNYFWEVSIITELISYSVFMVYRYKKITDENLQVAAFLEKNNAQYISNLYSIQENERIRIARDLHDSLGQKLAVIKMMLSSFDDKNITVKQTEEFQLAQQLIDESVNEVRVISHNLIPNELKFGLVSAINRIVAQMNEAQRTKITLEILNNADTIAISKNAEIALFRIVQEVTNNMLKHAHAKNINIVLNHENDFLIIDITDNGKGFDIEEIDSAEGIGWQNIFARAKMSGIIIHIHAEKNKGTTVILKMAYRS